MSLPRSVALSLVLVASTIGCEDNPRAGIEGTGQTGDQSRDQGPITADSVPTVLPTVTGPGVGTDAGIGDGGGGADAGPPDGGVTTDAGRPDASAAGAR